MHRGKLHGETANEVCYHVIFGEASALSASEEAAESEPRAVLPVRIGELPFSCTSSRERYVLPASNEADQRDAVDAVLKLQEDIVSPASALSQDAFYAGTLA